MRDWVVRVGWAEGLLVLLGLATAVGSSNTASITALLLWETVAYFHIVRRWMRIRRVRNVPDDDVDSGWATRLSGRNWIFFATLVASATGVSAGLLIIFAKNVPSLIELTARPQDEVERYLLIAVAVPAVVAGWLLLHLGFADQYARVYFDEPAPLLEFPHTGTPNEVDFAYFAFTVGATFAGSDVKVAGRRMRYVVLMHTLLSFWYNAVVLSIAIGVLTGG